MAEDSDRAQPLEPRTFKAISPRKPITKLDERGQKLCELMAWGAEPEEAAKHGVKPYEPLRLEDAARIAGLKLRNARFLFAQPVFLREYAKACDQLRLGHRARAISTLAGIMADPGNGLAADRAVQIKASTALLGPDSGNSGPSVQVNIGQAADTPPMRAGIVIRLKHASTPVAPIELQAVAEAQEESAGPAAGPRYRLRPDPSDCQLRYGPLPEADDGFEQ